jgi:uncharacterized protein YbjT (DUF2867 family)
VIHFSGGTGYLGSALVPRLHARGLSTRLIPRGDVFDAAAIAKAMHPGDTLIHLTGTPKPAPWKEKQFRAVDLPSLKASADAALLAQAGHFIYVSVAQPAPVMRAYVEVRREAETYLAKLGLRRTILRPWYVLGPNHWWPYALMPFYTLAERVPAWREGAIRLGLVTREQMVRALEAAVLEPAADCRIVETAAIRQAGGVRTTRADVPV